LRERYPALGVVVVSGDHDRASVQRALDFGAVGFIPKSAQREVMLSAFNLIFAGGIYIPPQILERRATAATARVRSARTIAADLGLTERQMDVLALMMRGKSNKVICRALDLAEPTVKNHVTAILKALKATNRTEAVIAAGAMGFPASDDAG
ncbi:MAG: LuxR C-terminal-related transcriptional regulator, partial [Burkholderiales bacterium]